MRRPGVLLAGLALIIALAGCAPSVSAPSGSAITEPAAAPTATTTDLLAARKAAGIADCPATGNATLVKGGLPDLELECLGGGSSVRLAALRGPMLINLWAQWCEPCRAEAAHLSAFATTQHKVAVLGINYQDPQPGLAIEFAQLVGATYPQLVDEETTIKGPLGVPGIPMSLLVGADGRIVARHPGPFESLDDLTAWVAKGLSA